MNTEQIIIVVLILVLLWMCTRTENYLAAPNFNRSVVDVYRDKIQDKKGMTVNDYALEDALLNGIPLNNKTYRIIGGKN